MTITHQIENINIQIEIIFVEEPNGKSRVQKYNKSNRIFTRGAQNNMRDDKKDSVALTINQ